MATPASRPGNSAARIVPRISLPGGGAIRIDQAVAEAVAAGVRLIEIVGGPGSGKTIALEYVQEQLADLGIVCLGESDPRYYAIVTAESGSSVVLVESTRPKFPTAALRMDLAPWGRDEIIEWAIGEPRYQRDEFVRRAERVLEQSGESTPEVLASVWSVLAENAKLDSWPGTINAALDMRIGDTPSGRWMVGHACWQRCSGASDLADRLLRDLPAVQRLTRHYSVCLHAAAEWVIERLRSESVEELKSPVSEVLLREIAKGLAKSPEAVRTVISALDKPAQGESDSNGASLLNLSGISWRPQNDGARTRNFARALLRGVQWPGVRLPTANLNFADLTVADLAGADLAQSTLHRARLCRADLRRAQMHAVQCVATDLTDAHLQDARLDDARLLHVIMIGADLTAAQARGAAFVSSNMTGVSLRRALMRQSILRDCDLTDADLTATDLQTSILRNLDLRTCKIDDLELEDSAVRRCLLGGVLATGLNCRATRFVDCDFTGSIFRGSTFAKARFLGCGLAEIWWQGADLREADFTGSTFHMGSSRSGLVGSTIAGEGSRTGFYTDDYNEQDYRPPEEIAKADLRGADLRGAIVEGVDFYLVDLRGAIYDERQAEWFRKCGAILVARV